MIPAATVLVVGPPLSGATAVAAALRGRLSQCQVSEAPAGPPDVVVFVVSAAAPLSHCDAVLLDQAAVETDAVVAAVAKTDVHRTWPQVLEVNRAALSRHAARYRSTPWVGVAAAPHLGEPRIDPLVEAVGAALMDSSRAERNAVRAAGVRAERVARRQAQAAQRTAARAQVRQTRLELGAQARGQAVALRAELQQRAASASRVEVRDFHDHVRSRVSETFGTFDQMVRDRFAELSRGHRLPGPAIPPAPHAWDGLPPPHQPATDRATVVFAAAFGSGVALTLGRLLVEFAGAAPLFGLPGCAGAGMALTVWVVRTRRLLAARVASDRWVAEVCAGLRSALEDRVLAAESSLITAIATGGAKPN